MYGRLIFTERPFDVEVVENKQLLIEYEESIRKPCDGSGALQSCFQKLMYNLFEVAYSQLFVGYCGDACLSPVLVEKVQEYIHGCTDRSLSNNFEIELSRLIATEAYLKGNWKTAILHLNSVVTRCCSDGGVHQYMVDVLIMLTEAYFCLNRNEDAMKSARLAIDLIHSQIERSIAQVRTGPYVGEAQHLLEAVSNETDEDRDVGFRLPRRLSQVCCYYGLAVLLHNTNLLKFAIGWYKRAVLIAEHHNLEPGVLSYLKDCCNTAEISLKQDEVHLLAKQQHNSVSEPSSRLIISEPQNVQARELFTRSLAIDYPVASEKDETIPSLNSIGKSKSALPRMLGGSSSSSGSSKSSTALPSIDVVTNNSALPVVDVRGARQQQRDFQKEPHLLISPIIISSGDALYYNTHPQESAGNETGNGFGAEAMVTCDSVESGQHNQDAVEYSHVKYRVPTRKLSSAVTTIQSTARGYNARKFVRAVRQHKMFARRMRIQRNIVVKIQRAVRKYLACCRVAKMRKLRSSIVLGAVSQLTFSTSSNSNFENISCLVHYLKAERKVIASKKEHLIRVTFQEKKKLLNILENANAYQPEHVSKSLNVGIHPNTSTKENGFGPTRISSAERKRNESPKSLNIPRKALFGAGQKIEAKFMCQYIKKHNITWHKGVVQHVHQVADRRTMEVNYTYDVKYSNGEIETRIGEMNVRHPILLYSNPAPPDPTADSYRPRICVAKRQKYSVDMHKTMMQLQFQAVGRRDKRKLERKRCKSHNIIIIQRICRGHIVRKHFAAFRAQALMRKIQLDAVSEPNRKLIDDCGSAPATSFTKPTAFSQYRQLTLGNNQPKRFNQRELGKAGGIGTLDVELHWETQQLNNDIQSYYDLLLQSQRVMKELREKIYSQSGSASSHPMYTDVDSPLFARLNDSSHINVNESEVYGDVSQHLEFSGNDISFYDNNDRVTSPITAGLVARELVNSFVHDAIKKFRTI